MPVRNPSQRVARELKLSHRGHFVTVGPFTPGQHHSMNTIHLLEFSLSDLPWWLILIRQKALVGKLPGDHEVCKVTKIAVLSLSEMEPQELELEVR